VLSIAALHGAVTLAWVAYNLYLVQLLVRAGFDAYLATVLLMVEGLAGALLEPVVGGLSDRARRGLSGRMLLVGGGALLASGLFVVLPLAAAGGSGAASLVPALLVAWACAMALVRAPALSLLARHARREALPLAASALGAMGALVGAAIPSARAFILSLGPLPTFIVASAALILSAGVVLALERRDPLPIAPLGTAAEAGSAGREPWLLFGIGTSTGLAFRLLLDGLPRAGAGPGASAAAITTAFFLGVAGAAIPLGRLALGRGRGGRIAAAGLGVLVLGTALPLLFTGATAVLACAVLLGAALAAVQNGLFASSLTAIRGERPGLGMGLLLGGGGLALGLFNAALAVRKPAPATSLMVAAGLYALTLLLFQGLRSAPRSQGDARGAAQGAAR
jgi:hypothetical protein